MKITIDNMLRLEDAPKELLEQIKAELTIKNPDYIKKRVMGLNRWAWGPEYIKLWSEKNVNGQTQYILPRGYFARLWEIVGKVNGLWFDGRIWFEPLEYPKKPQLRDYQEPALQQAKRWQQGCLIMPCGAGKTVTGMGIIAEFRQPTLWITHTMDLLKQSMDAAINFLGLTGNQIGIIQGENMKIGTHITFATVQTLYKKDLSEILNKFGCIMVDEAHLVFKDAAKARMFESVISQFPAFYRFGLTASEHRADGLIETMFHVIGPKFYEVEQDDLRLSVVTPRVEFIETEFTYELAEDEDGEKERLNVQQMYKAMGLDVWRNYKIINCIEATEPGDCVLVLGDSLAHLQHIQMAVESFETPAAFICGETPKKVREQIMANMRAGKYQYLFATYQLAKLGLDIPRLNKLVLVTPKRDKTSIQQAVGRIMRPFEGKSQPVVYDIYDSKVKQLVFWARERVRVYKRLGCQVNGGPTVRKY